MSMISKAKPNSRRYKVLFAKLWMLSFLFYLIVRRVAVSCDQARNNAPGNWGAGVVGRHRAADMVAMEARRQQDNVHRTWFMDLVGLESDWMLDNSMGWSNVSIHLNKSERFNIGMDVHPVLFHAKIISDPLYGRNEIDEGWVKDDVWTWTVNFSVPEHVCQRRTDWMYIKIDCIDTMGLVKLDGSVIGETKNMHRFYMFGIDGLRCGGVNHELSITIYPAAKVSNDEYLGQPYPVPHTNQVMSVGHYNMIRKTASDFGWDWGPAFVPPGVRGRILLAQTPCPGIFDVSLRQEHTYDESHTVAVYADVWIRPSLRFQRPLPASDVHVIVHISIHLTMEENMPDNGKAHGLLYQSTSRVECREICGSYDTFKDAEGHCIWKCAGAGVTINKPVLWHTWDHSTEKKHKKQPLYNARVSVRQEKTGNTSYHDELLCETVHERCVTKKDDK